MIIEVIPLGALQTNSYIIYDPESMDAIIIDPADDATFLAEKIVRMKLNVKALIATHGHFDHNLAAGELQLIFSTPELQDTKYEIPYYIHKDDLFLLKTMNSSATHWLGYTVLNLLPQNIQVLKTGNFKLSTLHFKLLHTPGHTPGSVCLLLSNGVGGSSRQDPQKSAQSILFSGDTLFKGAIGRYDFSYSDKSQLDASLKKLFKLKPDTIVYPGHGNTTTIGEEIDRNV